MDEPSATSPVTSVKKAPETIPGLIAVASWGMDRGIYLIRNDGSLWKILPEQPSDAFYEYPEWSMDGRWIVFSLSSVDQEGEIYLADVYQGTIKQLTYGSGHKNIPSWSPDGRKVAFIHFQDQESELHIMNRNGENIQVIRTRAKPVSGLAWSPDGKQIIFLSSNAESKGSEMRVIRIDGTDERVITDFPINWGRIDWSPDGKQVAFSSVSGCGDIYTVDIESGHLQQITNLSGREINPSWSPDGRYIAFYADDTNSNCVPTSEGQIYLIDLANRQTVQIATSPNWEPLYSVWSPVPALRQGNQYAITLLGDYLNLRQSPLLTAKVIQQLREGDSVTVIEGPVVADDYYWWRLRTADGSEGWAVEVAGWYAPVETPTP